jgi:hypothetical protein
MVLLLDLISHLGLWRLWSPRLKTKSSVQPLQDHGVQPLALTSSNGTFFMPYADDDLTNQAHELSS